MRDKACSVLCWWTTSKHTGPAAGEPTVLILSWKTVLQLPSLTTVVYYWTFKFRTSQLESKPKTTTITLPDYKRAAGADWDGPKLGLTRHIARSHPRHRKSVNIAGEVWQQLFLIAVHRWPDSPHSNPAPQQNIDGSKTTPSITSKTQAFFRAVKRWGSLADWTKFKKIKNECNTRPFRKPRKLLESAMCTAIEQEPRTCHHWWAKAKTYPSFRDLSHRFPSLETAWHWWQPMLIRQKYSPP